MQQQYPQGMRNKPISLSNPDGNGSYRTQGKISAAMQVKNTKPGK